MADVNVTSARSRTPLAVPPAVPDGRYNAWIMSLVLRRALSTFAVFGALAVPARVDAIERPPAPQPLAKLPGPTGTDVAFSRDGQLLLTAGGDEARVWDAQTYKPLTKPLKHEHGQKLYLAALSSEGKLALTVAGNDAWLWDVATSRRLSVLRHKGKVRSASFSPDGSRVITAADDKVARVWDAGAGRSLFDLPHRLPVVFAAFSPDGGERVFTLEYEPKKSFGLGEREKTSGHLWDGRTGSLVAHIVYDSGFANREDTRSPAAFSDDGKKLITARWGWAVVWDASTGRELRRLETIEFAGHGIAADGVALNADGTRAVTTYLPGRVQLWNAESGARVGPEFGEAAASFTSVVFAAGGRLLLAGHHDLSGLWDIESGRQVLALEAWEPGGFQDPPAVAISPDGKCVAAGFASDGFTGIWRIEPAPPAALDAEPRGRR